MKPKILNPENSLLLNLDDQWEKLFTILLHKIAKDQSVYITQEDIKNLDKDFAPGMAVLMVWGHQDSLEFKVITEKEAEQLVQLDRMNKGERN